MALRISQQMLTNNMLYSMNSNLSSLQDLMNQASSQKRVNKPSDDPYGTAQILNSRNRLSALTQYQSNISTATGWLTSADSTMQQVQTLLTSLKEKLMQGATGTYTADQRRALGSEAREILNQLIEFSNTKYGGNYIFSGHKTDTSSYTLASNAYSSDSNLADVPMSVDNALSSTAIIQFTGNGNLDDDTSGLTYRYSMDGGLTWSDDTNNVRWDSNGNALIDIDGATVTVQTADLSGVSVTQVADSDKEKDSDTGTWIYVYPTAQYNGDVNTGTVTKTYSSSTSSNASASNVAGDFSSNVDVKLGTVDPVTNVMTYYYSTNGGSSWTSSVADVDSSGNAVLTIPGGKLEINNIDMTGSNNDEGTQFVVRPHRADITLDIGSNASVIINNVGSSIFGGIYQGVFDEFATEVVLSDGNASYNIFEVVGKAVAALECNSQEGCQEAVDALSSAMIQLTNCMAITGGRENRVTTIQSQIDNLTYDENTRLSAIEDVDLTTLLVQQSQQQTAYNAVLKSSAMIMQMSLMNYL